MQQSDPVRHARLNLHSAEASLVTAHHRLSDAVIRFSDDFGCSRSFAAMTAPDEAVGWWQAQAEYAERAVERARDDLQRAIVQHNRRAAG
ncbi:MAG: hypothetical protein ABSF11_00020 [Methylocella sp.]|jgi:hypothetical protein